MGRTDKTESVMYIGLSPSKPNKTHNSFELETENKSLNISLNEKKHTKVKKEHAIEIGWMVALFWSFGINVRIGYKTEVEK